MPQFERGVYEPSDEVRVFDGSEEDEDMEGSRLPLLIVLALLVLAMFAGLVWLAYTQGVVRGRSETPVLTAAAGPVRTAPQNPGGSADAAYKGFKIYEQPAPPDEDADTVTPPAAPVAKPAATPAAPVAQAEAPPSAPKLAPVVAAPPPKPAPVIAAPKPAPVITTPKPAPVVATAKPAAAAPKPAPAPTGTVATGAPRSLTSLAAAPVQSAPVKAAPVTAPKPAAPAATGGLVLQIGAYKSQADAEASWKAYKAKHAALLSGYGPDIQQADLGEKGTWYRLRIAGFPDRDVASGLCDRLKADGGSCFLGK